MTDKPFESDENQVLGLDALEVVQPPTVPPPRQPDAFTELGEKVFDIESKSVEIQKLNVELEMLREKVRDSRLSRKQRKDYADKVFKLLTLWMFFVGAIVIGKSCRSYDGLSDPVLMTLMGTTTATVVGLFTVVLMYLFPSPSKREKD